MRSFSWEIFFAGFALFVIALVVTNRDSNESDRSESEAKKLSHISEWADLKELSALEKLAVIEEYKKQQSLEDPSSEEINPSAIDLQPAMSIKSEPVSTGAEAMDVETRSSPEFWTEFSPGSFRLQKNIPLESFKELSLVLPFGSIVVYGEDLDEASIELMASGRIRDADWLQDRISVDEFATNENTKISLVTRDDEEYNIQLQATLRIPKSARLTSQTDRGHIEVQDLTGRLDLQTGGGHIEIKHSAGELNLMTEGGHIRLEDVSGSVHARTQGGHIEMNNMRGTIQATTLGGNIQLMLKEAGDSIHLTTEAGNIQFQTDSDIPLYSTITAIAGIDFANTAITGNQSYGNFSGFIYPQSKLDRYAVELTDLFKSIDTQDPRNISFSDYGALPVINLEAKLGKVSAQFE